MNYHSYGVFYVSFHVRKCKILILLFAFIPFSDWYISKQLPGLFVLLPA